MTRSTEVALAVLVADCVPVLLAGTGGVVAAVHAGRPGLVAGVVPRTLEVMRDLGARRGGCRRRPVGLRALLRGARGDARRRRARCSR